MILKCHIYLYFFTMLCILASFQFLLKKCKKCTQHDFKVPVFSFFKFLPNLRLSTFFCKKSGTSWDNKINCCCSSPPKFFLRFSPPIHFHEFCPNSRLYDVDMSSTALRVSSTFFHVSSTEVWIILLKACIFKILEK